MNNQLTTKSLFKDKSIQQRFETILGEKAQGFLSSVLQIVNNNNLLSKADPQTVLNASITAAVLDIPINQNLGFAWIVPYKGKAQFQMGWKGYVQLALRTGQYKNINVTEVYENQFKSFNNLTEELDADFSVDGEGEIVGYAAFFQLINGFSKTCFWSVNKVKKHASKYSQTYGKKNSYGKLITSPWNDAEQFSAMCKKTVLKNTLSKWGILSIEMQKAVLSDQSIQINEGQYQYLDNQNTIDIPLDNKSEEDSRIENFIKKANSIEEIEEINNSLDKEQLLKFTPLINKKLEEFKSTSKAS